MREKDLNIKIGKLLRYGVSITFILSIIGIIIILIISKTNLSYNKSFNSIYSFIGANINHPTIISFLFIPIIIMIATPILRVALSILLFKKENNYKFVIITSIVFLILMFSVFIIS